MSDSTHDSLIPIGTRIEFAKNRFIMPVRVGDTVTVTDEIVTADVSRAMTTGAVTATNQHGQVVAVATHTLRFL